MWWEIIKWVYIAGYILTALLLTGSLTEIVKSNEDKLKTRTEAAIFVVAVLLAFIAWPIFWLHRILTGGNK